MNSLYNAKNETERSLHERNGFVPEKSSNAICCSRFFVLGKLCNYRRHDCNSCS